MKGKDWVSWNLIICGYGQLGHGIQAIELFEEMRKQKVRPNSITFLRVLSSCRHAGIVKKKACRTLIRWLIWCEARAKSLFMYSGSSRTCMFIRRGGGVYQENVNSTKWCYLGFLAYVV